MILSVGPSATTATLKGLDIRNAPNQSVGPQAGQSPALGSPRKQFTVEHYPSDYGMAAVVPVYGEKPHPFVLQGKPVKHRGLCEVKRTCFSRGTSRVHRQIAAENFLASTGFND